MSLRVTLIAAALLALTMPAQAQERLSASIFAGAALADWVTTYDNLTAKHGHEWNPAIKWAKHPAAIVSLGAAIDVAGGLLWWKATERHHRWRAVGFVVAAGARLYLAQDNLRAKRQSAPVWTSCTGPVPAC